MRARVWREDIILPTINYLIYSIGVGVGLLSKGGKES